MPAVIVNNLPSHLTTGGEATRLGEEEGVLFCRAHPTLAKFLVTFEKEEDRDSWHQTSPWLRKAKAEFGLRTSLVWFNRDSGLVMKPELADQKRNSVKTQSASHRSILQEKFVDLDKIFVSENETLEGIEGSKGEINTIEEVKEAKEPVGLTSKAVGPSTEPGQKLLELHSEGLNHFKPISEFVCKTTDESQEKAKLSPATPVEVDLISTKSEDKLKLNHHHFVPGVEKDLHSHPEPSRETSLTAVEEKTPLTQGENLKCRCGKSASGSVQNPILERLRDLQDYVASAKRELQKSEDLLNKFCEEFKDSVGKSNPNEAGERFSEPQSPVTRGQSGKDTPVSRASDRSQRIIGRENNIFTEPSGDFNNNRRMESTNLSEEFRNLKTSSSPPPSVVNLLLQDGRRVQFSTNRNNNISISALERFLSRRVVSLQVPEDDGYKELELVRGYFKSPEAGWGEKYYKVDTGIWPGDVDRTFCHLSDTSLFQSTWDTAATQTLARG